VSLSFDLLFGKAVILDVVVHNCGDCLYCIQKLLFCDLIVCIVLTQKN
jgi:hypothetical protein